MKVRVVRLGRSRGIRIPKHLLDQCGIDGQADLTLQAGAIVVTPATAPRKGWEKAFAGRRRRKPDQPQLPNLRTDWDRTEWRW